MSDNTRWTNGCSTPASIAPGRWPRPPPRPGKVRLNGIRVDKPGHAVKPAMSSPWARGGQVMAVRMLALAERRGPATEAQTLYELLD